MDGWLCQQRMGSRRRVHNCHADCCEAAGRFLVAEEVGERVEQHRHKMLSPFPWRGRESQSFVVVFTIQHRQGVWNFSTALASGWNLATVWKFRNLCLYKCLTTVWWARTRILVGILSWKCSSSRLVTSARLFSLPWLGWQPTRWEKRERTRVVTNAAMLIVWLIG